MFYQSGSYAIKVKEESHLIDEAWDLFSEYIGNHKLETPLDVDQFEIIFNLIDRDGKFESRKVDILKSFRYDSYLWPLVKR